MKRLLPVAITLLILSPLPSPAQPVPFGEKVFFTARFSHSNPYEKD
jgi:hypothetical protein